MATTIVEKKRTFDSTHKLMVLATPSVIACTWYGRLVSQVARPLFCFSSAKWRSGYARLVVIAPPTPTLARVDACRVLFVLYPLFLYHCNMLTYTYTLIYVFTTLLCFLTINPFLPEFIIPAEPLCAGDKMAVPGRSPKRNTSVTQLLVPSFGRNGSCKDSIVYNCVSEEL